MWPDCFAGSDIIEVTHHRQDVDVLRALDHTTKAHELVRKSNIKVVALLDLLDIFWGQLETERLDISPQMLDLAAAQDGEDVRRL